MKAAVIENVGGPEALIYKEVTEPVPGPGDSVIRVEAAGVNRIDVWIRTGLYKVPLPAVIGCDIAGIVEKPGDPSFSVGDRVVVYPEVGCGRCIYCVSGRENLCQNMKRIGQNIWGGYAEIAVVPSKSLLKIPDSMTLQEAAAIPVNFTTAWGALVSSAGIGPGMSVLIVGGGSGVGYAAIQIAKLSGAYVVTTVSDDSKVEKAYQLGADLVINRLREDVVEGVMRATDNKGVDIVLEHAGASFWPTALKVLAPGGTLVTVGATTGQDVAINVRELYRKRQKIVGSGLGTKAELMKLLELVSKHRLRVIIDSVFKLSQAAEAHRRLESNKHFGKILLIPDGQ
ncbi:MAG: zinc-binding dehydrogenase [Nitrososphaerota archaeon]